MGSWLWKHARSRPASQAGVESLIVTGCSTSGCVRAIPAGSGGPSLIRNKADERKRRWRNHPLAALRRHARAGQTKHSYGQPNPTNQQFLTKNLNTPSLCSISAQNKNLPIIVLQLRLIIINIQSCQQAVTFRHK